MFMTDIPASALAAAVDDARAFLRMENDAEEAIVTELAASAIAIGEAFTGMIFLERGGSETVRADGCWRVLDAMPVTGIQEVCALAPGGVATPLPPETFAIDLDAEGLGWARVRSEGVTRALVRFTAGFAPNWSTLPAPLRQGVAVLTAYMFDDRSGELRPPAAVAALWKPFRRMRLSADARTGEAA